MFGSTRSTASRVSRYLPAGNRCPGGAAGSRCGRGRRPASAQSGSSPGTTRTGRLLHFGRGRRSTARPAGRRRDGHGDDSPDRPGRAGGRHARCRGRAVEQRRLRSPAYTASSPRSAGAAAGDAADVVGRGCPVPLSGLRRVVVRHWDWNGRSVTGTLIVSPGSRRGPPGSGSSTRCTTRSAGCRRWTPVTGGRTPLDRGGQHALSTAAARRGRATGRCHAYGEAIDLNPIENPYLDGGQSSHRASAPYENRSRRLEGMVHAGDAVVAAARPLGGARAGAGAARSRTPSTSRRTVAERVV